MDKIKMDLLQVQTLLARGVEMALPGPFWVRAEIASLSVRRNGHCYMDLSQSVDGELVAQVRAIAWSSVYRQIEPYFQSVTGVPLQIGQQVLLMAQVNYSPLYGLSLIINDIDPDYTLGDAERKRAETLERLRSEDLLDAQKELVMADLPYSLAVVSAEGAAGYRDFMRHLHENPYGFRFKTTLFQAAMQGSDCAASVASAIAEAVSCAEQFDAVLLLRGGGGKLDLACYDEYEMCAAIARCPLPVLTAVGHDQDTHLCDMVAHCAVKTPTALADWFLEIYMDEDARLTDLQRRLDNARRTRLQLMEHRLDLLAARLDAADPRRLLERGYIIALDSAGHPLKSAASLSKGSKISLMLSDGTVSATVDSVATCDKSAPVDSVATCDKSAPLDSVASGGMDVPDTEQNSSCPSPCNEGRDNKQNVDN